MEIKLTSGKKLVIERDDYANDPRQEWDYLWTWVSNSNRYFRSDNGADENILSAYFEDEESRAELMKNYIAVPIYAYIHSGATISLKPFSCPWDSGVGFIAYIDRDDLKREGIDEEQAMNILEGEVEEFDHYLRGHVYWFGIENEDGENEDSCGGFLGMEHLLTELQGNNEISKEDWEKIKDLKDWDI